MNNKKYFFAVDLGATSGRTIIGSLSDGKFDLEELTRFDNNLIETGGHFYWDIFALYFEIIKGLKLAASRQIEITSIGIDTWGVDFVCIGDDNAILRNPLAYRDPHTFGKMEEYLQKVVDRKEVYHVTGIQFMNFNSLFQLYAMKEAGNTALRQARKILFVPDALSWMLTGEEVCEYTIASTSQMLDPRTKDLDKALLASVGLSRDKFGRMVSPGTQIGVLTDEVQRMTGLGAIPVIAVAGHDTGSAVAAVPAKELNFTNEGGVEGTTRFLKNICGMWLYERCRKEWPDEVRRLPHPELQGSAMQVEAFRSIINPDDAMFANPSSMIEAIQTYCRQTGQPVPETPAEICRCIFDSLALRYRQVFGWLKEFASFPLNVLHIIGGGSLNKYLNQFTANSLGVDVLAGPQEGTAIGNIMLQAKAAGEVKDIWEMRQIIANSLDLKHYAPEDKEAWDKGYEKYLAITAQK